VNFRWAKSRHIGVKSFDLLKGVDDLFDRLESMVEKEKSRVQDHRRKDGDRGGEA
jgi:ribosome-associated translation inhibitor RaiA